MFRKLISISGQFPGRRGISALYLSGDKAKEQFAVLTPYMDIARVMNSPDSLVENIFRRNLPTDLHRLYERYELYVNTTEGKRSLEEQREEIHQQINDKGTSAEEKQRLTLLAKSVRDAAKSLRDHSYGIESNFILQFLALPNAIHPRVPDQQEQILFSNISSSPRSDSRSHLELDKGRSIELVDATNYFYKGDVARFDYLFPHYCCTEFLAERGFHPFSNPDFVRTILVEGGRQEEVERLFRVREEQYGSENVLHLAGGGSMLSYLGFLTKLQIFPSALPLKLVATGKQYKRVEEEEKNVESLFNVTQSTAVQAFGIGKDEEEALRIFDELVKDLEKLYRQFGDLQFRMVVVPAAELASSESLKVALQMYSNSREEFVEVGNVAYYGDYISKRLLFSYKEQKENRFPHLVSATVVDVAKLVACRVENNGGGEFKLPEFLS